MKKKIPLLAIAAILMPSAAFATNHFKLGTQWTVKVGYDPASQKTIVYTLEDGAYPETEEQDALTLFRTDENGERTLEAVILCEGEKVFFYDYDSPGGWELLYDFSLQPGDETTLFSGMYNPDSQTYPKSVGAKCEKIETSLGNIPYEDGVFFLKTYNQETGAQYSSAIWYDGIGSTQGPLANFETGQDGILMNLVKVTNGDEVLFDYDKLTGIQSLIDNESCTDAYRIDGTKDNGQPGIVISNGKKLIRKATN